MSRDENDLHPEMKRRWNLARDEYARLYPKDIQPFLTQTLRTLAEQNTLYAQGRTKPGKRVTNAMGGQSLHNYGLAFDIGFQQNKSLLWDVWRFAKFAAIAKRFGLSWGGNWISFKDYPHFEPPKFTWQMAQAGIKPTFPELPN